MSPRSSSSRRQQCGPQEALSRYRQAATYLEVARAVASESERPEDYDYNHVAAGLAVLAAIAASDALCCRLLGERSRGHDHREAIELVASVRFGEGDERARGRRANSIARNLATALDLKDQSHYGVSLLEPAQVRRLLRAAGHLVEAAASAVGHPINRSHATGEHLRSFRPNDSGRHRIGDLSTALEWFAVPL